MPVIPVPCLCLVTDRRRCQDRAIEDVVAEAVEGGVDLVQVREKDLPAARLLDLCARMRKITAGKALLFVSDRVDVAVACGADGVQLGEESLSPTVTRRIAGESMLLGRSVHSLEGAAKAASEGVDLLIVGTIFATSSHPGAAVKGAVLLRQVRGAVQAPYLAIGGVNPGNVESAVAAGAAGAAVISAICDSDDPETAARVLKEKISEAWALRSHGHHGTPA